MEAKDYEVEGKVIDIGLFFVELKTKEGKEISLPNNIFIQKMIKKKWTFKSGNLLLVSVIEIKKLVLVKKVKSCF
jgi:small-conductance mechanosensitive channel